MRICQNCGYAVEDGAYFCKRCGARVQNQPNAQYAGGVHNQNTRSPGNNGNRTPNSAPSGKKKKGETVWIVALVLLTLAIIGNFSEKKIQDKDLTEATRGEGSAADVPTEWDEVEFDKGRIDGGWYVNEWAELNFPMSGWNEGTAEEYDAYSSENAVVGAVLQNNATGTQVVVGFERLIGVNRQITEEMYLNTSVDNLKEQFQDRGIAVTASGYSDADVAGNLYKTVTLTFTENSAVESLYARKLDGYMAYIVVAAIDAREGLRTAGAFCRSAAETPPESPEPTEATEPTGGGLVYTDGRVPHYTGTASQWERLRYEWPRQDKMGSLCMELNLDAEMYRHYLGLERYQGVENYHYYTDDPNNRAIVAEIVRILRQVSGDIQYSESDTVREVANFVQNVITYETDPDTTGREEYPRYPIETLYERRGDCEDTSILMAALLRELGYEVGFFHLPGHVAVALRTTDDYSSGMYYEVNGHRYLYIESTATGWNIGDIPDDMKDVKATFYPLQ